MGLAVAQSPRHDGAPATCATRSDPTKWQHAGREGILTIALTTPRPH
jgi:hypothetical protein